MGWRTGRPADLPLPAAAGGARRGGGPGDAVGSARTGAARGIVPRAAREGRQRRRDGVVLPQLSAGRDARGLRETTQERGDDNALEAHTDFQRMAARGDAARGHVGAGPAGKHTGNDHAGGRHDLSGGRVSGDRNGGHQLARVFDGGGAVGVGRQHLGDDRGGRRVQRAVGSQRGIEPDGQLLHGGLSPERWKRQPRVLGGAGQRDARQGERHPQHGAAAFRGAETR